MKTRIILVSMICIGALIILDLIYYFNNSAKQLYTSKQADLIKTGSIVLLVILVILELLLFSLFNKFKDKY